MNRFWICKLYNKYFGFEFNANTSRNAVAGHKTDLTKEMWVNMLDNQVGKGFAQFNASTNKYNFINNTKCFEYLNASQLYFEVKNSLNYTARNIYHVSQSQMRRAMGFNRKSPERFELLISTLLDHNFITYDETNHMYSLIIQ